MSTKEQVTSQKEVFDRMAPGWYNRRHYTIFRPELDELARRWNRGRLLNIGCGHGADFLPFCSSFELHGMDFSPGMLRYALKYSQKFQFPVSLVLGDSVSLPYKDGVFSHAISVATYHHIREKGQRSVAVRELHRVLEPGGEAFITVWNRCQPAFWFKHRDTTVRWRTRDGDLFRYYHLFLRRELEGLVKRAGFTVLRSFAEGSYHFPVRQFSRNICLLVRKG